MLAKESVVDTGVIKNNIKTAEQLIRLFLESNIIISTTKTMTNAIRFMPVWYHHLMVAEYSKSIAESLQCPSLTVRKVYIASLLHDISKLFWTERLHLHPYKFLTDAEKEKIKNHPKESVAILEKYTPKRHLNSLYRGDPSIIDIILMHHEKPDGSGYYGVKDINKAIAIVSISDIYDACTENRPYRLSSLSADKSFKIAVEPFMNIFAEDELFMIKRTLTLSLQEKNYYHKFFFNLDTENIT